MYRVGDKSIFLFRMRRIILTFDKKDILMFSLFKFDPEEKSLRPNTYFLCNGS